MRSCFKLFLLKQLIIIPGLPNILSNPIEYLKGVGPQRAELLKKELGIFTFRDLLEHFPYRHVDKTKINRVADINFQTEYIQVAGIIKNIGVIGNKNARRLTARLEDKTGSLELTWFQGISWVQKTLQSGHPYLVYGKVSFFQNKPQIIHPEIELLTQEKPEANTNGRVGQGKSFLEPVYPSTEKLKARGLGGRQIGKLTQVLVGMLREKDIPENLPITVLKPLKLADRYTAYRQIHFPPDTSSYDESVRRLKFEELFMAQLRMNMLRSNRHRFSRGVVFDKVGELFNSFYKNYLPFQLTGAQKRVVKEIRMDTGRGKQMNRLLQGDVGSGKTIVAVLTMLLAIDNGYQACLMAPTEILARQHFSTVSELLAELAIPVKLLTGSTRAAERKKILKELLEGELKILIGTHAVIEEVVQFNNLGIVIIDEQHRFGVAQRARLWQKAGIPPHILVMTATPIPRTLAMTAYGDLDYSVIDELPPGRQPVTTVHRYESQRSRVMDFLRAEVAKGRQVYIIFPLIEESDKLDYENLMRGYETVKGYFPEPKYWISMVHGRQPGEQKELNMKRFVEGDTQIMVSTTVIEVGVNVPNATVMVIESAEKFGLSQLHQLRGRVGRGADKSYCILLSGQKLGNEARERIRIMCTTSNGFEIAEKDLELRGPGDIEGTRQSGVLNFKLANIVHDKPLLELAKKMSTGILEGDPDLVSAENLQLKRFLEEQKDNVIWSKIS
ncbi:MAG: ATP-dependent DNA helicase RecG [Bacteroidota bacterium]|nr:ATP-dependent DNA helicase RecG [Bacteroidota bacterium]